MQKQVKLCFVMSLLVMFAVSCQKDPGEGGNSSITGKVFLRNYNSSFTTLQSEYYDPDEYVYIVYGEGPAPDDRVKTGPDGDFDFKYLRKGTYTLYVYSDDSTGNSASGTVAVYKTVTITKNRQTVDAGTITILKN